MQSKFIAQWGGLILSSFLISACPAQNKAINYSNTLRVDIGAEIPTFDPAITEDNYTYRVINDLYAGLVDFDQKNQPIPGLASSWEIGNDGLSYVFHLRDNLKFSNGLAIKASDFVFSWRRLVDPATGSSYSYLLKDVLNANAIINGKAAPETLGIIALDDNTLVVHLSHPSNAFLSYLTTPNTYVVSEAAIKKYGNNWTLPQNIVTSGAYVLKKHIMNGYVLATKNPYFYQESSVSIKNIKYFPFVDANASLANYRTGELDTTWQNVPVDQYRALKKRYPHELYTFKWERMDYLNLNFKIARFANNIKLRQALAMAIDREDLTRYVLGAGQEPLYSLVTPTIENGKYADVYYPWSKWPRDKQIAMAQKLYREAGYGPNKPLVIKLKYQTNDLTKKVMIAIMSMWQQTLGVNVTLANEDLKAFFLDLKNANYEVAQGRWGADYNSITTYTPLFLCNSGNNRSHYCNRSYDSLISQADATVDITRQEALYKQALEIALADYAIIPLYEPTHQRLVNPRVLGYSINDNYLDNVQSKWFHLK